MYCVLSFIFILIIAIQLNNDSIGIFQFILYTSFGLVMFYHTSKPYWEIENKNRIDNQSHHKDN